MDEIVKTSVRIPKLLHKELKQLCLDEEKTEVKAINEAIAEYVKHHEKS